MNNLLTIGNLGKQVGLPTKTIRFYEEIGLIKKAQRGENDYRVYEQESIEELSLIKYARDLGLPIPEIKKLMVGCEDGNCDHTKEYVQKEIGNYIAVLDKKIKELQVLKDRLQALKKDMAINSSDCDEKYCCNILSQLVKLPKGGEK